MTTSALPQLSPNVVYLGSPDGPEERPGEDGSTVLFATYRVNGLDVEIGWIVGNPMGNFREPNQLKIDFESMHYGLTPPGERQTEAWDGITTSVLRAMPMAHARALMRDRHEQLSVVDVRRDITPLPSRVETDRDYVHVATAYVALGAVSVEPIKRLAEWTGESVDTWSARLRRARAKGILEGTGRNAAITSAFQDQSNEIWSEMRERRGRTAGD
ncbi:hypothetical protein [Pseudarthrobacter sp. MDT3-1]